MAARSQGSRPVRPKAAASLVLLWRSPTGMPSVFMGRRGAALRFMPGFLVFPGGRLERQDRQRTDGLAASTRCTALFEQERSEWPAHAFLQAAMRECREETGLDALPHLASAAVYFARAVTPPHFPVRYDTRFFFAELRPSREPPLPEGSGDGELLHLGWFTAQQLADEPLHHVTRAVLERALRADVAAQARLLIADRRPKHWEGSPPLRSRDLKAALGAANTPPSS